MGRFISNVKFGVMAMSCWSRGPGRSTSTSTFAERAAVLLNSVRLQRRQVNDGRLASEPPQREQLPCVEDEVRVRAVANEDAAEVPGQLANNLEVARGELVELRRIVA